MSNDKKKSKYFRDGSEPKSKYDRSNAKASKYIKSRMQTDEKNDEADNSLNAQKKNEYRKNVITPKRAKELMLEEERKAKEAAEETAKAAPIEASKDEETAQSEEIAKRKGNDSDIFKGKANDKTKTESYDKKTVEDSTKNARRQAIIRMVVSTAILTAVAAFVQFFTVHVPFTPSILTLEFSAFPELIASIAYGPVFGILICLIKNVIHVLIVPTSAISALTNLLLDSVFVFIAGFLYSRSMFFGDRNVYQPQNSKKKDYRPRRIFTSAVIGALISLVPQFFITRYIAYPMLERLYSDRGVTMALLLEAYQGSIAAIKGYIPEAIGRFIPSVTNISRGIILVNLPVTFVKLFLITSATALIYKFISPFLHYRHNPKTKHKNKS